MKRVVLTLLFLGLPMLVPAGSSASGLIFPMGGAKAQGMSGAWVAQGDDLSVLDHNPAQLINLQQGLTAEFHYFAFYYRASFDPAPVPGLGDGEKTSNAGDYVNHIPNLYGGWKINDHWAIAGGLFTPYGPRQTFEDDGPQRYQIQRTRVSLAWGTVAAAWRPVSAITLSLGLDIGYPWVSQRMAIPLVVGMRTLEGQIQFDGTGDLAPRPKVGLLIAPIEHWTIGAVFAPGVDFAVHGKIRVDFPAVGFDPDTAFDNATASQRYPLEARLAVGFRNDTWRWELTGRYFNFSEYTEQLIDLKNNQIGVFEFEDITLKKDYRNSFAVQSGAGYDLDEHQEVRWGYTFDMSAAKDSRLSLTDYDGNRHILGVGYGLDYGRFYGNLGLTHVIYHKREVTTSEAEPIAIVGEATILNNGVYRWGATMAGISFGARF
ncbi:MAG: hypothetical protein D6761_01435 [Candidatus Dadabacteria bacterium]|nr:MAG: hypothetical protein D6761_01435 [Candidatus Dadabacteria bacterium]